MFGLVDFYAYENYTRDPHGNIAYSMQPLHWQCYLLTKISIIMKKLQEKPTLECMTNAVQW